MRAGVEGLRGGQLHRRPLAGGFRGLRGGQLDPPRPLQPLNRAAADVAPGVSGVEGAG